MESVVVKYIPLCGLAAHSRLRVPDTPYPENVIKPPPTPSCEGRLSTFWISVAIGIIQFKVYVHSVDHLEVGGGDLFLIARFPVCLQRLCYIEATLTGK